jgi:hypothetical protein
MIRIAITAEAFAAIAATISLGSVAYEAEATVGGERYVWLDTWTVDKLTALRGPTESYSDVILRLAVSEGSTKRHVDRK